MMSDEPLKTESNFSAGASKVIAQDMDDDSFLTQLKKTILVDIAHVIMLHSCGLMERADADKILRTQQFLLIDDNSRKLLSYRTHRGVYVAYENYLIDNLGEQLGGAIHLARSRNDINAVLFKFSLREHFESVCEGLIKLRRQLLHRAIEFRNTPFVIYSQYQPALPGTFGHYLFGIEKALARVYSQMELLAQNIDVSPLGAGAGGGTDMPINPFETAELLGFSEPVEHSLDAVSNRDDAIHLFSILMNVAVTVSRFAQDLQIWTMMESGLIHLPDHLVGTSSMLPQKRNPYLLEKIKGKCASVMAFHNAIIVGMLKTPFSNSVEVGTESLLDLDRGVARFNSAIALTDIIVQEISVNECRVKEVAQKGVVNATNIANQIVSESKLPYRVAYEKVATRIKTALAEGSNPFIAISQLVSNQNDTDDVFISLKYGGGAGSFVAPESAHKALKQVECDSDFLDNQLRKWREVAINLRSYRVPQQK